MSSRALWDWRHRCVCVHHQLLTERVIAIIQCSVRVVTERHDRTEEK